MCVVVVGGGPRAGGGGPGSGAAASQAQHSLRRSVCEHTQSSSALCRLPLKPSPSILISCLPGRWRTSPTSSLTDIYAKPPPSVSAATSLRRGLNAVFGLPAGYYTRVPGDHDD